MWGISIVSACGVDDDKPCIWSSWKSRPRVFGEDALAMDVGDQVSKQ